MVTKIRNTFILLTITLSSVLSFGQLVTSTMSPQALVENVLIGNGVSASNIQFTGANNAIAYFNGQNSNIGMAEGLVITTGTAFGNGSGPIGPNNSASSGTDNGTPGYNLLNNLTTEPTYNASILEFDFVPSNDTVSFNFVFASEEYPEYVCSDFNDVFAFFISGPNPAGGNYINKNIALIPGTNTPIAINNVNSGQVGANGSQGGCGSGGLSNSQYYVNNNFGNTVQYDGFTTVLKALSKVECGETYHLRIAIADVGDGIYDSGIFLEANSLESPNPVNITTSIDNDIFGDGKTIAEDCAQGEIRISREGSDVSQPLDIPVTFMGTATLNVDYTTNVPALLQFAPGQTELVYQVTGIGDALVEGQETIILELAIPDPCKIAENVQIEYYINDLPPLEVTVSDAETQCIGEEVFLVAEVNGGGPPYTYSWNTGSTNDTIWVSPTSTQVYTVSVMDDCIGQPVQASATVTVPEYIPLEVLTTDDIVEICPFVDNVISSEATGGIPGYTYSWVDSEGNDLGTNPVINVAPEFSTSYTVTVTDNCGDQTTATVNYSVLAPPLVLDISPATKVCPGDSALITVFPSGGWGDYTYYWPHSGETTQSVWVKPGTTTSFLVQVQDSCATFTKEISTVVQVIKPIANFWVDDYLMEDLLVTFHNVTQGGVTYWWDLGNGETSTDVYPQTTYTEPGWYDITLVAWNEIGCVDTIQKPIRIKPEFYFYAPNAFTPDGDGFNDVFSVSLINPKKFNIQIFNRWGELIFESDDPRFKWDGTYRNKIVQDGVYVYKIFLTSINDDYIEHNGHVSVLR